MPSRALGPLVLLLGLALTGCGGSATFGAAHASPRGSSSSAPAPYPGSSVSGFQAVDLTWVSDQQGWALGIAPGCSGQRCATVLETTDGGGEWTTVADLHACLLEAAPVGCPAGVPQVSQIRFATADIGYAYASDGGPYSLTTNGGLSWTLQSGRDASAIKVAYGTAVRVSFSRAGCPGPCDWSIDQSALAQNAWQTLYTPPASVNHGSVVLLRQGPADIYAAFVGEPNSSGAIPPTQLVVSTDAGSTWTAYADPCAASGGGYRAINFAAAPGGVLVALCSTGSGRGAGIQVSSDSGAVFGPFHPLPRPRAGAFMEIAAISARTVFVAAQGVELVESTSSGQRWTTVVRVSSQPDPSTPTSTFLGFESPSVGRWIGPPSTLWTTTDGGSNWTSQKF